MSPVKKKEDEAPDKTGVFITFLEIYNKLPAIVKVLGAILLALGSVFGGAQAMDDDQQTPTYDCKIYIDQINQHEQRLNLIEQRQSFTENTINEMSENTKIIQGDIKEILRYMRDK